MRERAVKVDTTKLVSLSRLYKPTKVAQRLQISKQRWNAYQKGVNDIPESIVQRICRTFDLPENELVLNE